MTDKLRVLFLIDSLKMGGAERITVALMPFLQDITAIICTLYDHESPLNQQLGDVQHIQLNAKRLADPSAFMRYLRVLSDERIDVVHAQLQHATVFASLSRLVRRTPFVVTRHVVEDDVSSPKKARLVRAEHMALRFTNRLIYVSEATSKYHQQQFPLPAHRRIVVYNGIETDRFDIDIPSDELRQRLGFPSTQPIVTMVGVMRPGKGHTVCIEAARLLPDIQFMLVGDGDPAFVQDLKEQAIGLKNIHFLGTRKDIPEILHASDLLVLPSDSEALPTVLIEAGAAGLAVVATSVGGIPEIIKDGESGILIPPKNPQALVDAVRRLIDEPGLREKMGQVARQFINEQFSLQTQARNLTKIYQETVHKSR